MVLLSGVPAAFGQISTSRAGRENLENFYIKLQSYNILQAVQKTTGASNAEMSLFQDYYQDKIFSDDRQTFWNQVQNGSVQSDSDVHNYARKLVSDYITLYQNFEQAKAEFPSSISQGGRGKHSPLVPQACNPACDNIDFSNGNLNGWYAYYRVNSSTPTGYVFSAPVGGACGPVTASAWDPNTNTYQVSLTSGPGLDPIAGALIPVVCPGSNYSCMIGDGPNPHAQMGTLSQTFTITQQNANFVYMYAVVLENPAHNYYQQPFFNVVMLDQNNDTIPNCGNYSVVSGPGLPGYHAIYYPPDGDTVYCKPWTTVFVPLQNYIGQCVTIIINTSDCALGGHFGYAYFAAKCSVGIISSSPVLCKGNDTLVAPSGVATYKWTGPCIIGPTNNQKAIVGCPGTYKCALASVANPLCADTVSIVIPPYIPMQLSVSGTNISCNGGNNGTASVSASGGVPPYKYLWSPGGNTNSSISNLTAGTYTVVVKDSDGCPDTAHITLTQPLALSVTTLVLADDKCFDDSTGRASISVSGGTPGYSYIWSPYGGTNAVASNLVAGSYTVTATDAHGCFINGYVTITEPPQLNVNIGVNANVSCYGGNNGVATASATGGTPGYNFSWAPSGGNNATASNLPAGSYTVTVTDANSCTRTASVSITQPSPVAVTINLGQNVTCYGGSDGSATGIAAGGAPPYLYLWSNGSTSATANNLSAGSYTITVTDANGCTGHNSVIIIQPALLTSAIGSYTNVSCYGGNNGTATVTISGGTVPYAYAWSNGNTTVTAVGLAVGTYTAVITDAHSCTSSSMVTIQQPAQLSTSFTTGAPTCYGMNNGWATANVSGGTAPYNYAWSNGSFSATTTDLIAGTYTVLIHDAHACPTSGVTSISQPTLLTTIIGSISNPTCYGYSNGSATAIPSGGTGPYSYYWYPPVVQYSATATGLKAGSYTVKVTDNNGCTTTTNASITQPSKVHTGASAPDSACSGSPVVINAWGSGGIGNYSYQWSAGNGTSASCIVSPYITTTYTVSAIDGNGCKGDSATVTIKALKLVASAVTVKPNQTACQGDTASIYANVNIGNSGPVTISWSNGYYGAGPYTVNISSDTVFTVTVTDMCGDTVKKSIHIQVTPAPVINIPPQGGAACSGVTLWFKDTNLANNGDSYLWNFGDNQFSTQSNPSHTYTQSGLYDVTVQVTNSMGCKATASADANITVYPAAQAQFTADPITANIFNPTINFINQSQDATFWTWYFGDGDSSNAKNPSHTFSQPGTYYVTLTTNNDYGCNGTVTDSVIIEPEFTIWIPSAFTPNGDGKNDYFTAKGIGIAQFSMMIFDRWGNQIFTTNDISRGWDGRANGGNSIALEDVYVYKIQVTDIFNEQHAYIGSVTLIK